MLTFQRPKHKRLRVLSKNVLKNEEIQFNILRKGQLAENIAIGSAKSNVDVAEKIKNCNGKNETITLSEGN